MPPMGEECSTEYTVMSDSPLGETSGNLGIHQAAKSTASFNLVHSKFLFNLILRDNDFIYAAH